MQNRSVIAQRSV